MKSVAWLLGILAVGGLVVLGAAGLTEAFVVLLTAGALLAMIALGSILGGRTTPDRAPSGTYGEALASGALHAPAQGNATEGPQATEEPASTEGTDAREEPVSTEGGHSTEGFDSGEGLDSTEALGAAEGLDAAEGKTGRPGADRGDPEVAFEAIRRSSEEQR